MKKTAWYPGDILPIHIGVYERKFEGIGVRYSFWDGDKWFMSSPTLFGAYLNKGYDWYVSKISASVPTWRGLVR